MHYNLLTPPEIVFGWGRRMELPPLAKPWGRHALVVPGSRTLVEHGTIAELTDLLREAGMQSTTAQPIRSEPTVQDVDRTVAFFRDQHDAPDAFVLAIGGGAALDLGKAVAAMLPNRQGGGVEDYLEGVGQGLTLSEPPLPVIALPTTAGTGSEATKNAVLSGTKNGAAYKKSLRDARLVPRVALVDPELTASLPPAQTAHSGLDALTQLIESYLSSRAQPVPQALALEGLSGLPQALIAAYEAGTNQAARERVAHAALLSGMALANSGLGLAHGVAAALGAECNVPHGLACAVMLPIALDVNREVAADHLARLGEVLAGRRFDQSAKAIDAAFQQVDTLLTRLHIPRRLSELGVTAQQIPALVKGSRGNSMNGNPRQLTDAELHALLEQHR